jgi:integrase
LVCPPKSCEPFGDFGRVGKQDHESHDLPRIRFDDLRHTDATHLLANGIHPKVAQERLGHSSIGITLDLYSHVLPGMQGHAAAKIDAAIRAAIDRT